MSIFDDESHPDGSRWSTEPAPRRPLRERIGWWSLGIAIVIGVGFALLPSPYVIERPGPVYDTLGVTEHDGDEIPLIEIPDEPTYPTDGELNLLTVSVLGRPGATPNWFEVIGAWFDRTTSAVPVEAIFPPGVTQEQRDEQNQVAMVDSQQDAIAAALVELDYDFPREVTVASILEDSPSEGVLEDGDVIDEVNGAPVHSVDELRLAIADNGTDAPVRLSITRDDAPLEVEVEPIERSGQAIIGIGVRMHYEFPFDVEIRLDDVGGPSAGMMFALGIIDKLTPDAMTGGEIVAGTGTIDAAGRVGPIGGIRQKLWGADEAGADWFLSPAANCAEVVGNVPVGLRVFSVETLDQARTIVDAIGTGADIDEFATCDAG